MFSVSISILSTIEDLFSEFGLSLKLSFIRRVISHHQHHPSKTNKTCKETEGKAKDELMSGVLLWIPKNGRANVRRKQELIYISSVRHKMLFGRPAENDGWYRWMRLYDDDCGVTYFDENIETSIIYF